MATIAKLKVMLTATTAAFDRGMGRAAATVRGFGAAAHSAVGRVRMLGGSLLTMAAGGGLAYLGTRAAGTIDTLGKTADKLGATTEGLATQRHIADLSGVSVGQYDTALQQLIQRVGMVAAGEDKMGKSAKMAARYFKALGLDAKALAKLPADEIFKQWAEAMGKVADPSQRAAYAFKFLGQEGVGVLNMIDAMTKNYAKYLTLVDSLGIRLTREQVYVVEQMNDAFTNLRTKMAGVVQQTMVKLAPVLEAVFDRLRESMGDPKTWADRIVRAMAWLGRGILRVIDAVVPFVLRAVWVLTAAVQGIMELIERIYDSPLIMGGAPAGLVRGIAAVDAFRQSVEAAIDSLSGKRGLYERVTGFFETAIAGATKRAADYARGLGLGRFLEGDDEDEAGGALGGAAARFGIAHVLPSEIGGFVGGRPRTSAFFGGSIELKVQKDQLQELRDLHVTVKRGQGKSGMGV